jgi:hypothetical protein
MSEADGNEIPLTKWNSVGKYKTVLVGSSPSSLYRETPARTNWLVQIAHAVSGIPRAN